jgi:hypothetical protein
VATVAVPPGFWALRHEGTGGDYAEEEHVVERGR